MAFKGLIVAAFESRMATEITRLIERYGGRPLPPTFFSRSDLRNA